MVRASEHVQALEAGPAADGVVRQLASRLSARALALAPATQTENAADADVDVDRLDAMDGPAAATEQIDLDHLWPPPERAHFHAANDVLLLAHSALRLQLAGLLDLVRTSARTSPARLCAAPLAHAPCPLALPRLQLS